MEGVSYEAASLAGHLGLDNLIAIYDSNDMTIDGSTNLCFSEDVEKRYEAMGWKVEKCGSKDVNEIYKKLMKLKKEKEKPKLLIIKSLIGEGLDKLQGLSKVHSSPVGCEEIAFYIINSTVYDLFKKEYGIKKIKNKKDLKVILSERIKNKTLILESINVKNFIKKTILQNKEIYKKWQILFGKYEKRYPKKFEELNNYLNSSLPDSLRNVLLNYDEKYPDSIRNISGRILNICSQKMTNILAGSADLVHSTKVKINNSYYISS